MPCWRLPALRGLRRAPLTESRAFGRFTLRDIQIAEGEIVAGPDEENIPDTTLVGAAFQDTGPEKLGVLREAAETAAANIKAISARFDEMTPGQGPDLDVLARLVGQIVSRLRNATGGGGEAETETSQAEAEDAPAPAARAGQAAAAGGGGAINSPNDVANALDRIIAYYKRSEPSSPVPLLLLRAKRLVSADFLTIIKDMAPRGVENVNLIGGLDDE